MKRIVMSTLVAAVAVSAGAIASAGARPATAATPQRTALLAKVGVTITDSKFTLSAKSAKRGIVIFTVTNVGTLPHNFSINGRTTNLLSHGENNTLRVTFLRRGTYAYKST